jgi:hypothetical protein
MEKVQRTFKSVVVFICETESCTKVMTKRQRLKILMDIESTNRENKANGVIFFVFVEATAQRGGTVHLNGANVFCFLSSLPLLPPATAAVFGSYLSPYF